MEGLRILRLPDVKPPCLTCPRRKPGAFSFQWVSSAMRSPHRRVRRAVWHTCVARGDAGGTNMLSNVPHTFSSHVALKQASLIANHPPTMIFHAQYPCSLAIPVSA